MVGRSSGFWASHWTIDASAMASSGVSPRAWAWATRSSVQNWSLFSLMRVTARRASSVQRMS